MPFPKTLQHNEHPKISKLKLVILISGSGSNLQAFIDATLKGVLDAEILAVISNKEDAFGLERAKKAGIKSLALCHNDFPDRESFDQALAERIDGFNPDLIILAGFMRILSEQFVNHFLGKMINIHPSLLPKYPGLNTHQRAIDAGDDQHGASVHYVIPELDSGPVIVQGVIDRMGEQSVEQLASRLLKIEHLIYPLAVEWIAQERIKFNHGLIYLDGEPLGPRGYRINYDQKKPA